MQPASESHRLPPQTPGADQATSFTGPAAGFVSRLLAMAIDLAVVTALIAGAGYLAQFVGWLLPHRLWITAALPVAIGAFASVTPLIYFSLTVAVAGRTVGKAVMGLRVVAMHGNRLSAVRSLLRAAAYAVSVAPLFAGFLWVLVDADRRGWHDHIAGSRVVHERLAGPI
jgi:uncharacterized RDD family membrane protein YckC